MAKNTVLGLSQPPDELYGPYQVFVQPIHVLCIDSNACFVKNSIISLSKSDSESENVTVLVVLAGNGQNTFRAISAPR